jgi:nucleotidyltransferase substrate binding protein (TIGR01987 family)
MSEAAPSPDVRWKQRLHNFQKALVQLENGVQTARKRELNDLERQGLIQAFEFNHELAWKTLKDYLEDRGETQIHGSKDATRKAFQRGLIDDGEIWMEMIESRNRSTHTYNDRTAAEIAAKIVTAYLPVLKRFGQRFLELEKGTS